MTDFVWVARPKRLVSYLVDDIIVKTYLEQTAFICLYGLCIGQNFVESLSGTFIHSFKIGDIAAHISDLSRSDHNMKFFLQPI